MSTPQTMQAVIFGGPRNILVEERSIPTVQEDGDAIVKVTATALCGSELHTWRGGETVSKTGFIMGHEFVGYISDMSSSSSSKFKIGDRVVSPFTTSCDSCWFCSKGYTSRCAKGQLFGSPGLDGGQAGFVRVPLAESTLFHAPDDLPEELLVTMADIFPTGYHASSNARDYFPQAEHKDMIVVVIGCGPVGICAITAALEWVSPGNLYAIDSVPERLLQASHLGAISIPLAASGPESALEIIKKRTDGRGCDAVLEIVGLKPAMDLAVDLIRPFGFISSVGVHSSPTLLSGASAYNKNLKLSFGRCPVRAVFPDALECLRRNKDILLGNVSRRPAQSSSSEAAEKKDGEEVQGEKGFVSHWLDGFDQAAEAFQMFEDKKARKVVFRPVHKD